MFKWRDDFSCNVNEIDNQHKKLFEIGSRLHELASLNDEYDHYDEIMAIMDELTEYTEYHFAYEEKLMQAHNYQDYDTQKIEHDFFVKKLKKLKNLDIDENQNESVLQMIRFVADWITSHILKSDMQYSHFFNSKGVC